MFYGTSEIPTLYVYDTLAGEHRGLVGTKLWQPAVYLSWLTLDEELEYAEYDNANSFIVNSCYSLVQTDNPIINSSVT